jgi:hypothetical protein
MNCGSDQWVKGTLPKYRHISHDQLKLAACDPDSYSNLAVNCVSLYNTERLLPVCGEGMKEKETKYEKPEFWSKKSDKSKISRVAVPRFK